jgi:predicted nucleotidyltransferase
MSDPLARMVAALEQLERSSGFRIAIIGGVARGVWAAPRATMDVDVLVDTDDATLLEAHAHAAGLVAVQEEVAALRTSGMTRLRLPEHLKGAVRLDVIAADHPYYQRVVDRSRPVEVFGRRVRVAAPEDVLLLKLLADRTQDRADIEAIVAAQTGALDLALLEHEAAALELELPPELRRPR